MVFKLAILHRLIHYLTDSFSVFLECTEKKPKIDFKSKSFSENEALSDNQFYSALLDASASQTTLSCAPFCSIVQGHLSSRWLLVLYQMTARLHD